ncbi:MAG: rRNA maturation RNase YbeY [bacterium]|nr:rRNA maturation RNase YbeY [bacterium]
MLHLCIEDEWTTYPTLPQKKAWYQHCLRACNKALNAQKAPHISITVVLTDDAKVKEYNTRYRKLRRTTDVLSFYYGHDNKTGEGEIFISIPYAARQAHRYGSSLTDEVARLVIHGIFHIYGYDHKKLQDRRIMRALETKAFTSM